MRDIRFATRCESLAELLETLDVDSIDDFEFFLMYLFALPIDVYEGDAELEVVVSGKTLVFGVLHSFPVSVEEIVAGLVAEEDVEYVGTPEGNAKHIGVDLSQVDENGFTAALARALGVVRIATMLGY